MIETLFLPLALAFIMFSLGLALRPGDFRVALYGWRGIAMGLCGQVLLLPLLAFLISVALDLSPTAQLGLMLIAACPGGVSSAFLTHLARGNIALSLILTVTSSLLALITLPLIINAVVAGQSTTDLQLLHTADLPLGKLLGGLLLVTTLPILLGMFLRLGTRWVSERGEQVVGKLATLFFLAIVLVTFVAHRETITTGFPEIGMATLLLNALSLCGGVLLARLAQLGRRESIAIAMECGLQNAGLGIFIALTLFQQPALAIPSVVYALTMNFGAIAFLWIVRRQAARMFA
ncbi:MAG TPA: bile acid:sodium symporter family protein [Rhodocyclaceae bacterium]|nr:bile acid:sodium symporter family protein [Rhodocyclaceae bacterium]